MCIFLFSSKFLFFIPYLPISMSLTKTNFITMIWWNWNWQHYRNPVMRHELLVERKLKTCIKGGSRSGDQKGEDKIWSLITEIPPLAWLAPCTHQPFPWSHSPPTYQWKQTFCSLVPYAPRILLPWQRLLHPWLCQRFRPYCGGWDPPA